MAESREREKERERCGGEKKGGWWEGERLSKPSSWKGINLIHDGGTFMT
jgi:hypothetical protein